MKNDSKFTLYWRTGDRSVVQGRTISEAFTLGGYSAGALRALDFYAKGDNTEYYWDSSKRKWIIKNIEKS